MPGIKKLIKKKKYQVNYDICDLCMSSKVWVSNVHPSVSNRDIYYILRTYGVKKKFITKISRFCNYLYLYCKDSQVADHIITRLNGYFLYGQFLFVEKAYGQMDPKEENIGLGNTPPKMEKFMKKVTTNDFLDLVEYIDTPCEYSNISNYLKNDLT